MFLAVISTNQKWAATNLLKLGLYSILTFSVGLNISHLLTNKIRLIYISYISANVDN